MTPSHRSNAGDPAPARGERASSSRVGSLARRDGPRLQPAAIFSALTLSLLLLGAGGCGGGKDETGSEAAFKVGLVFDVGGLGDKSFNDAAYRGLLRARDELGIGFEYYEPAEGSEREAALRLFAAGDQDLILGIGFLFTDDVKKVAAEFPEKEFSCVDYTWKPGEEVLPNVVGIKFREEEGSYLVGAIAALCSKTGTLGFIGGMDIPLIHKFQAGYTAGAMAIDPATKVLVNYAGVTGDAFQNPSKGKELGLAQIDKGADILFHASGSTGLGVFEAARERGVLAIGVDSDQQDQAPGHILTSMTKQVDVAVYELIRETMEGQFSGGVQVFGLAENGVDYVYDENNQKWITDPIHSRVEELRARIIDHSITVPTK